MLVHMEDDKNQLDHLSYTR